MRPGPPPKRSEERRRRNKVAQPDRVIVAGEVLVPDPDPDWHPIAADWYSSLAQSGQSEFYEPSDWAAARMVAEAMSRNLGQGLRFSGQLFSQVWSAMGDLLTTEGARRRFRVEVERQGAGTEPEADPELALLDAYREALGA